MNLQPECLSQDVCLADLTASWNLKLAEPIRPTPDSNNVTTNINNVHVIGLFGYSVICS